MSIPPVDRSMPWRAAGGANLYSTGASGAVPVSPVDPVTSVESLDAIGRGAASVLGGPADAPDSVIFDWSERAEARKKADAPPDPPKEPISKQLLEFLQSVWRASANAVDMANDIQQADARDRNQLLAAQQPLTYSGPKRKL